MSALTLVIQCPDQKGIIAEVTQFIYRHKGNILYIDQYVDRENKAFFMRLESEFNGDLQAIEQFQQAFTDGPAEKYQMTWSLILKKKNQGWHCLSPNTTTVYMTFWADLNLVS